MYPKSSEQFLFVSCVIAIVLIDGCYSSTFITPPITHPNYPGKCFEPVTLQLVKPGQNIDLPNTCIKLTCLKDFRFGGVGCSSEEAIGTNCRQIPGDRTLTYPYCCPHFECDEDNLREGSNSL